MNETFFAVVLIVLVVSAATIWLVMKTTELTAAVNGLSSAIGGLTTSVNAAVDALNNRGASTPDADIVPLIDQVNAQASAASELARRLDLAVNPPAGG